MTSVVAQITQSLDGYVTGPDDGPGRGLGEGGEAPALLGVQRAVVLRRRILG